MASGQQSFSQGVSGAPTLALFDPQAGVQRLCMVSQTHYERLQRRYIKYSAAALHVAQTQLSGYNAAILTATHVQRRLFMHDASIIQRLHRYSIYNCNTLQRRLLTPLRHSGYAPLYMLYKYHCNTAAIKPLRCKQRLLHAAI